MQVDDTRGRYGSPSFRQMGTGHPATRNCMPCGRNVLNQVGGAPMTWRGVARVWHCADCRAKRAECVARKATA